MSIAVESYASAWRPRDKRSRTDWCREFVQEPNMARGSRYDPSASPWFIEPLDYSADNRVREQVILCPTGAGKSSFVTCFTSHTVAEDEGDILLAVQGNTEAKKYVEKRLIPCLRQIPSVRQMLELMDRHAVKKGSIGLPDKTIYWGGANETNAQATSARAVVVDEAWMADHGLLEEFRARLHNRWNGRFIALGQGGYEKIQVEDEFVDTEWAAAWLRSDQREWHFQCPQCSEVQRYRLRGLKYERQYLPDETLDQTAVIESARYECIGNSRDPQTCNAVFEDKTHVRRMLCNTGRYVVQHPKHRAHHHGWHINALGIWYESWGNLAVSHALAHIARKRGDTTPFRLFRQKRMAENYRPEDSAPNIVLTTADYSLADYANGETWDGELYRFMTIDRQQNHRWVAIRAWKPDGSSRLLFYDKVLAKQGCRDLQLLYKVPDKLTFQDAQYEKPEVYRECAEFGWNALHGTEKDQGFKFISKGRPSIMRAYSGLERAQASSGGYLRYAYWSNLLVKDELMAIRSGKRGDWQLPKDVSQVYQHQINSEAKKDFFISGKVTQRYVAFKRDNHAWDTECMQAVAAWMLGLLPELATTVEPDKEEAAA